MMAPNSPGQLILVTGASGYIGGRLVPRLLAEGFRVRCLARSPEKLLQRPWASHRDVEIVAGDVGDRAQAIEALGGCHAAFYLVHSMIAVGRSYAEADAELARGFAEAAAAAGVARIIYLGGLGETGADLSTHLSSRREVERLLASTEVPVTVLRAAMIIGSGSASFEILRYLTERLPIMITPRWVRTRCQPIAVRDVLHYLVACLREPATIGATLDIGGPDVVSYATIVQTLAELRGLPRRLILAIPVLTPRLSSLWIHLVTPISARIARPLAEGLRNEVICRDARATELMRHRCLTLREALSAALGREQNDEVETSWSDAGVMPGDPQWAGGTVFTDRSSIDIDATATAVYTAVCRVGGGHGWYAADWLWRLRGILDRIVGGPGLRRGRRSPSTVRVGDALDFWRVTHAESDRKLELRAEMKLPGIATLTFEIEPTGVDTARMSQTARFKPRGLLGLAYWYSVLPLHGIVFRGMMRGIRRTAEQITRSATRAAAAE